MVARECGGKDEDTMAMSIAFVRVMVTDFRKY